MAFTYNLEGSGDELLISEVRLEIGDTDDSGNKGVKSDGGNFTDAEIMIWLEREDRDVLKAAGAACANLARHWANQADLQVGPRREALSQIAQRWASEADRLREAHGGTGAGVVYAADVRRSDGYAAAYGSDEYKA